MGWHLALATLLMAILIIVLFFYDFHFVSILHALGVLDRWLPLDAGAAQDAAQLKVH